MSTQYPSNLSDAEWACLQRSLPPLSKRGRPPTHSLRALFDAIFYVLHTGCPWRYLPCNFPPWQTVFSHFRRLRLKGAWCQAEGEWDLEVVERTPGTRGFSSVPRRWVVERSFGWLSRKRRLSKDYERKVQTSETLIQVAMIRLLLTRLGRSTCPVSKHAMNRASDTKRWGDPKNKKIEGK